MSLKDSIIIGLPELRGWRRSLHANPELAFQEKYTARFVTDKLQAFGIDVTEGIGKTGIVASLRVGKSERTIGLRADMDALPMQELNTFPHKSKCDGVMHGCGHDGHTVMLLAAAQYLAQTKQFDGTVHFIFQPAEEANDQGSGAKAMMEEGLFERFPMDCVFALHNAPGLKSGAVATRTGPIMASMDLFDVTITGHGTHGAFPQSGTDPVVIASAIVTAWQTIVSRNISPQEQAVISATSIHAGDSYNVIPHTAVIQGSIRTLSQTVQAEIKRRFHQITQHIAEGFGATVDIQYHHAYPVTVNDPHYTQFACEVAESVVGADQLINDAPTVMGSEDFAYMLQEKPGCYLWVGNSDGNNMDKDAEGVFRHLTIQDPCMVHEPTYDFNDSIIPTGASLLVKLAETYLSKENKENL